MNPVSKRSPASLELPDGETGKLKRTSNDNGPRILVIDDDEVVLEAIKELLEKAGYQVHCLVSPIGATQVIMTKQIQAVVVDLNMPVMHGDRFISLLRSWDRLREIPCVLISGAAVDMLAAVAKQLPGVATVAKDTMHRTLPETLQRMLTRAREAAPAAADALPGAGARRK
jgi:CheY-like chemotaxis protein